MDLIWSMTDERNEWLFLCSALGNISRKDF